MSEQNLRKIYDELSHFESNSNKKATQLYPVHKNLKLPENKSLFDLLLNKTEIPKQSRVLDMGCGVGYGLLFLNEKRNCSGLGISISPNEVSIARENAKILSAEDQCKFEYQNYDDAIEGNYDIILAVESLKHSADLSNTFQNILRNLNPGGKMIIVEDFLADKKMERKNKIHLKSYQNLWALFEAYTKKDFENCIDKYPELKYSYLDLSQYIPKKPKWKLWFTIQLMKIIGFIPNSRFAKVAPIFIGGLHLELLYHFGFMSYEILLIEKHQSS